MKTGETYMAGLASEFFVAAQLLRQGYSVSLTLGNTKEVDLAAHDRDGNTVTIDVKGLKNTTNWPLVPRRKDPRHFYVLVAYHNRFLDLSFPPEIYVVPSMDIEKLLDKWAGRPDQTCVSYSRIKKSDYRDAWHLLVGKIKALAR